MEMIEDMENRNNHKNQETVKTVKTDKTASAIFSESLKSLMQIFVESAKVSKCHDIFATFAIFATSASANFVGKESNESTEMYRVKSRIPSCLFRYSLDPNLSRFSLASLICLCMLTVGVGNAWGTEVSVNIGTYATSNSWSSGTAYSTIYLDANVTATGLTNGNNSKYYSNSTNKTWRHYEGNNGTITIETSSGALYSVTFTYANDNNGVIQYGGDNKASGTTILVSGTSAEFTVGHSSGSSNGNVQITDITVVYFTSKYTVTYNAGTGSCGTASYTQTSFGESITLPEASPSSDCEDDGWELAGWKTSAVSEATTESQTLYTSTYVPSETGTLYAVYKKVVDATTTYHSNPICTYDYFYDIMHGNVIDAKQGTYAMPAAPDDATPGDDYCGEKHFHFIGWLEEQYINDDGTLKDGGAAYIIPAGDTGHTANNKNYYAIWSMVAVE